MTRVPVLMYHSVDDDGAAACVRPQRFEEQIAYLARAGYRSINLDQLDRYLKGEGGLPEKAVVITFDDGYRDNLRLAAPILRKYGMCATIFLAVGHLGKTNAWNAATGTPQRELMSWEEVDGIAGDPLISFEPHTVTHPRLSTLAPAEVARELTRSKEVLEKRLGRVCRHFAYPYGDWSEPVRQAVKEAGFSTACTTRWGHCRPGDDPFILNRIGVANGDTLKDFKRIMGEPPPLWRYYLGRLADKFSATRKEGEAC